MSRFSIKALAVILMLARVTLAQDSPFTADPGTPPPPQGYNYKTPEGSGIHLPKKKYKIKLNMEPSGAPVPKGGVPPSKVPVQEQAHSPDGVTPAP